MMKPENTIANLQKALEQIDKEKETVSVVYVTNDQKVLFDGLTGSIETLTEAICKIFTLVLENRATHAEKKMFTAILTAVTVTDVMKNGAISAGIAEITRDIDLESK